MQHKFYGKENYFMNIRTDLAVEANCFTKQSVGDFYGIRSEQRRRGTVCVTEVEVLNGAGASAVGKPIGKYVTLELGNMSHDFEQNALAVAEELAVFLPAGREAVLVAGLGNREITPDSIGPLTVENTMITRHLTRKMPEIFGSYRPVSAIAPGVLGATGIESAETVSGAAVSVAPALVLVVDALASRSVRRLCTTVQITDTGIIPGSGVGNSRAGINSETLGVPVVAIGVPTVVDAATLALDVLGDGDNLYGDNGEEHEEYTANFTSEIGEESFAPEPDTAHVRANAEFAEMFVTPREIDLRARETAKLLGYAISMALHNLDVGDVAAFLK